MFVALYFYILHAVQRLQREKEEEQKSLAELAAKRDAALKRSKENPVKTVEADLSSDEDDMPVR